MGKLSTEMQKNIPKSASKSAPVPTRAKPDKGGNVTLSHGTKAKMDAKASSVLKRVNSKSSYSKAKGRM